jgi:predicted neutral ceramidase superfamily lipid hydrolase
MARALFKYICPESDKMDKRAFGTFVEQFGLNTYNFDANDLFEVIANRKQHITTHDFYDFVQDIPLESVQIKAKKRKNHVVEDAHSPSKNKKQKEKYDNEESKEQHQNDQKKAKEKSSPTKAKSKEKKKAKKNKKGVVAA